MSNDVSSGCPTGNTRAAAALERVSKVFFVVVFYYYYFISVGRSRKVLKTNIRKNPFKQIGNLLQ